MALPFFRCLSYLLRHVRAGLCICLCSKPLCAFVLFCPPPTGGGTKKAHINKCITPRGQPFASLRVAASRNFDLACASQPPLLAQSRLSLRRKTSVKICSFPPRSRRLAALIVEPRRVGNIRGAPLPSGSLRLPDGGFPPRAKSKLPLFNHILFCLLR